MNIIFGSVEQMLSPAGLSGLMGAAISEVERSPLSAQHFSGNILEQVRGRCAGRPISFVLKRFRPGHDWVMRLTHDSLVREVQLYQRDIYERLPEQVWVPILAAAHDDFGSWATLQEDVSTWLISPETVSPADLQRLVQHLAVMHARFLHDTALNDPALGLSSLTDFLTILSPKVLRDELGRGQTHPVFTLALEGWAVFEKAAPREIAGLVRSLQEDPTPVLEALSRMPHALLHGDFKLANLGSQPFGIGPRTIVLDWQDAAYGPPLLDLAYWLAVNPGCFPGVEKDKAIQRYRASLADSGVTFSDADWEHDLAVCLLAGGGLRLFWQLALATQVDDSKLRAAAGENLEWWSARASLVGRIL